MTWLPGNPALHTVALAFLHQMTTAILKADGELSPAELAFLDQEFPSQKLVMAGFVRPATNAYTFAYYQAAARGFSELPAKLDKAERAQLIEQLTRAAKASTDIAPEEFELITAVKSLFS